MSKFLILCILVFGVSCYNFDISINKTELIRHNLSNSSVPISQEFIGLFTEYKNLKSKDLGKISAVINNYTDKILGNVRNLMIHKGFDPLKIDDIKKGFSYHFLFVRYHGEMQLTEGWLEDLSTLHRVGDVEADYSPTTKKFQITVPVGFNDIYLAKLMGLGPTGGVEGKVSDFRLRIKLGFDFEKLRASLDEFHITNTHTIKVNFTGHILLDWIVDLLSGVTMLLFKQMIIWIVEIIIRGNLKVTVDSINTFLEHIFNETSIESTNLGKEFFLVTKF